ncbi:hypothetical protein FQN57_002302 [Myotisia sp. PD_48]|nr:hypothetical protein FQN57_002302 [Myotisia sp. PD_48]
MTLTAQERPKIFIAVMGVTGAGKSTFIQTATGSDDISIGHTFKSCTAAVAAHTFRLDKYDVTLIDTPGFNDTFRSETEVLKDIANWLDYTYRHPPHVKLTGIIYMQSITDRRMYGSTLRNLKMFRELCGEDPLRNVVFTTTGWGTAEKSGELNKAIENEESLRSDSDFWEPMIRRGSIMQKFSDTRDSALAIIRTLLDRNPVVLKIQEELVDENKNLIDTAAGFTVNEEMKRLEEKYTTEIAKVQQDMEQALAERDTEYHAALQEAKENYERLRDEAQRAQDALQYERRNEKRRLNNELEGMKRQLQRDKKQLDEELKLKLEAQRVEDEMKFEEIVKRLRDNGQYLRPEERTLLENKIKESEAAENGGSSNSKKKGRGTKLLIGLAQVLGSVTMGLLGFPMLFGDPIGTFSSIFSGN